MKTKQKDKYRQKNQYVPDMSGWESMSGAEYHTKLREVRNWYYENYKETDLVEYIWEWMKNNGYDTQHIKAAKRSKSFTLSSIIGINCKLLLDGVPDYNEQYAEYWAGLRGTSGELKPLSASLKPYINEACDLGMNMVEQVDVTPTTPKPTIQERVLEQSRAAAMAIDEWLSNIRNPDWSIDGFDFRAHFESNKLSQTHTTRISSFYKDEYDEINQVINMPSAAALKSLPDDQAEYILQLKEGYSNFTRKQLQQYRKALETIITECNVFGNTKRAVSKDRFTTKDIAQLVSKLKYCHNDVTNNLTSVSPSSIVGSEYLWIYNTRTRKLGCYVAENVDPKNAKRPGSGLSVKGSSIVGFNPERSVQKTVKKPAETLREFASSKKNEIKNFLDKLNTVDSRLTGRITADIILLRTI